MNATVKELLKSVNIFRSYHKNKVGRFFETRCSIVYAFRYSLWSPSTIIFCVEFLKLFPNTLSPPSLQHFPRNFAVLENIPFTFSCVSPDFFVHRIEILQYHSVMRRNFAVSKQQHITLMFTRYVYQTCWDGSYI